MFDLAVDVGRTRAIGMLIVDRRRPEGPILDIARDEVVRRETLAGLRSRSHPARRSPTGRGRGCVLSGNEQPFRAIGLTGGFANAMLGGVIAGVERLDPVGFAILAVLSGLGGGLIRHTRLQTGRR